MDIIWWTSERVIKHIPETQLFFINSIKVSVSAVADMLQWLSCVSGKISLAQHFALLRSFTLMWHFQLFASLGVLWSL